MQSRSMRDYPSARRPCHPAAPPTRQGGATCYAELAGESSHTAKTSCWLELIPVSASGKTRRLDSRQPRPTTAGRGVLLFGKRHRARQIHGGPECGRDDASCPPQRMGGTGRVEDTTQWRPWGQQGDARTARDYRAGASWLGQGHKPLCGTALRRWVGSGEARCVEAFC